MISPLGLLSACVLVFTSIVPQASDPPRTPEAVLGFECMGLTQEQISTVHPGLKLPAKQHVVLSKILTERFASGSSLSVGDILIKVDGKMIKTLDDLSEVLGALKLPSDVRIEYLNIISGPKPRAKRESVTLKAVAPAVKAERPQAPRQSGDLAPPQDAAAKDPQVRVNYDRFKDKTFVNLSDQEITRAKYAPREFQVSFAAMFDGKSWEARPSVSLVITSAEREWHFMNKDRTLYLLIDDEKPVELPEPYYSSKIGTGRNFCTEYMSWTLPPDLLARLQEAKKIECRVWIVEFGMPAPTATGIKEFQRTLDGLAAEGNLEAPPERSE